MSELSELRQQLSDDEDRSVWGDSEKMRVGQWVLAFGSPIPNTRFDPDLLNGWGTRFNNWEFSTSVQHEILPRVSVDVGYFRRWYGNFAINDNLAWTAADFDTFSVTADTTPPTVSISAL